MYADVFVHKPECTSAPKSVLNGSIAAGWTPHRPCREALFHRKRPPRETDERTGREPRAKKKRDLTTRTQEEKMKETD